MTHGVTAESAAAPDRDRTVSAALKAETAEHHKRAEGSDFQRQFVGGRLPLGAYTGWLEQMLCVYRALESHLLGWQLRPAHAALLAMPWQRSAQLADDLEYFGVRPDAVRPVPATAAFLARLEQWARTDSVALLGVLYVLEGSTNGSRFIARVLRKAYNLEAGRGLAFLDPHGEGQVEQWRAFKQTLDGCVAGDSAPDLIGPARETFEAVTAIGDELLARQVG
jgi:heme oxygenase